MSKENLMLMGKVVELFFLPFILLFAGAWISQRLIPSITQKWQNYQKALELKTGSIGVKPSGSIGVKP